MAKLSLVATLKGVGTINNGYIYLEDVPINNPVATEIGLFPSDTTHKTWTNGKIKIDVIGDLEYQLNVHAFSNTDWTFELTTKPGDKKILSLSGTTGVNQQPGTSRNTSIVRGFIAEASL